MLNRVNSLLTLVYTSPAAVVQCCFVWIKHVILDVKEIKNHFETEAHPEIFKEGGWGDSD